MNVHWHPLTIQPDLPDFKDVNHPNPVWRGGLCVDVIDAQCSHAVKVGGQCFPDVHHIVVTCLLLPFIHSQSNTILKDALYVCVCMYVCMYISNYVYDPCLCGLKEYTLILLCIPLL